MQVSVSNKHIIRLAAPISLALVIPQISFLTNTLFLGRLGEQELGVNGVSGIFYLMLSMIGYGLSSGLQVQMARRAGEGDHEGIARTLGNGMLLVLLFSLSLMLLSLWLAPLFFGYNLHNNENIFLTVSFLYIRVWGLPFLMLTQLLNAFFISVQKSGYLIPGSIAGTLANIIFDYFFIFGNGGFPAMGLEGAALASILGELAFCLTMFLSFYLRGFNRRCRLSEHLNIDWKLSRRTLQVASPLIVQYLFSIGGWQLFFIYVEHLGKRELATSQILRSVFGIVGIFTWAFAATCNTMVSNIIGQGREREVLKLTGKIARLSFLVTIGLSVVLLGFSDYFLSLYRDDAGLVAFALPSLRVIVLASLVMSVSTVVFNAVVGTGRTLVNLTIEVACVLLYVLYCTVVIERMRAPLHIAWMSEFVYWTSLIIVSFWYLRSGRWMKAKTV